MGEVTHEGTNLYQIGHIAEQFGFKTDAYELSYDHLAEIKLPCIAHYDGHHFVVIYKLIASQIVKLMLTIGYHRASR